jgi:hypothetical protein
LSRLLLLFVALVAFPAMAREWFVSPEGDNALGDGSRAQPFRTVGHVLDTSIDLTKAGDTIILRKGVYHECDVRLRKRLSLRAETGESAHIQCDMQVKRCRPDRSGSQWQPRCRSRTQRQHVLRHPVADGLVSR